MRFWTPLLAAATLLVSSTSLAVESDSVAVLELENQAGRVKVAEVQFITDMVRKAAKDGLDPAVTMPAKMPAKKENKKEKKKKKRGIGKNKKQQQ